jgi:hypothetical protein
VATGAHEIAGLEGTLHIILEKLADGDVGALSARLPGSRCRDCKTDRGRYGKAASESSGPVTVAA